MILWNPEIEGKFLTLLTVVPTIGIDLGKKFKVIVEIVVTKSTMNTLNAKEWEILWKLYESLITKLKISHLEHDI